MNTAPDTLNVVQTGLIWRNTFQQLGSDFFTPLAPHPLHAPYWVGSSDAVAQLLGLHAHPWQSEGLLQALSGNQPISGTQPLASVYSGHQFGHWAGQLGDGRAILLGETNGLEVQLKGAGLTPYSRMGDGRAVLRSSIREFLCSEAMHGLGIPTTRALCVTGSDDKVWRETPETAAVVTRVAPSFIRFGHFEHFAARKQLVQLRTLADFVIDHHYPDCRTLPGNVYAHFLQQVVTRTAVMVAHWQAVGFCHGVMNTDNMSILGLTIDYGPFQFLDAFDPGHICNHSDQGGRYAFENQPSVANWNLYCLAEALMPLIEDQQQVLQALKPFKAVFDAQLHRLMCAKLGLPDSQNESTATNARHLQDQTLWVDLLKLLAQDRVDYTLFWHRLSLAQATAEPTQVRDLFLDRPAFDTWMLQYSERTIYINRALRADLMLKANPKYVLRNYMGEEAIQSAKNKDFAAVADLLKVLQQPFDEHPSFARWAGLPPEWAGNIAISCSS